MSWIALDDLLGVIQFVLSHETVRGAINAVAPNPVTNREFTKTLGTVLGRPTIFPMPAFAARLAFGEMADALLLSSARVEPRGLLAAGYAFRFPTLEECLRHLLGK
jgi:NAD dependent epimerase/dehydratase family enzyme